MDLCYSYAVIVPHHSGEKVLLISRGDRWELPNWTESDLRRPYWQDVSGVTDGLQEHFGLATPVLRCLGVTGASSASPLYSYLVMPPPAQWAPPSYGRWIAVDDLERLPFAQPVHLAIIRSWLGERGTPGGPPWYSPSWFDDAVAWIHEQLGRLGRAATGPVEQVRSWERSSVLRIPTADGLVYFKAVPKHFAHEVALLSKLADWYPGTVQRPLAFDQERHWWLMEAFDGIGLDQVTDSARWEAAVAGYAALQVGTVAHREGLLALGCPVASLTELPTGLLALLADEQATMRGDAAGLTMAEITRLRDLVPQIAQVCERLDACAIPATLEHGDLWASNVLARFSGGYRYFDWSDSSIAHPFFSLFLLLKSAKAAFPGDAELLARLRGAYLEVWTAIVSPERAHEAFALSQRLAPLHHAVNYHQRVLPAMWQCWEMERMVPYYLRCLLATWDGQ